MKCEDISKELIAYLDRRANSAERRNLEEHLVHCAPCRGRAEEFREVWTVLEEVPAIEPSLGFDARLRQRIAAEPRPGWLRWLVPQPRLAFSVALLLVLSVWIARLPQQKSGAGPVTIADENEQFQEIKDLGVLDNYDVLTKFDALSELAPLDQPKDQQESKPASSHDNGGA